MLVFNSRCKLKRRKGHRGRRLLERSKGSVEVITDVPGRESGGLADTVKLGEFDDHWLWTSVAEVEPNSLENHALNPGHGSRRALKRLGFRQGSA